MLLIGLTGSIGMGKSTAAARFRFNGVPVVDADALVHALYEGAAVAPIEAAFPGVTVDGRIDRQKLSALLMADPAGFKALEAIVHPLVFDTERRALAEAKAAGATLAVLEVPLLFETGGDARVDVTVVVSATADLQRTRVMARAGMTAAKLDAILKRQMNDAEKRQKADFVVDTSGDIATTEAQIDAIVVSLRARDGSAFAKFWA
ncbi:MAG: dephospho-CoA kinase [Hyphomicrobiaceae bacterium]